MKNQLTVFVLLAGILLLSACTSEKKSTIENPFFMDYDTPFNIPPFEKIGIDHYLPAFERAMDEQNQLISQITATEEDPTFENTIEALEYSGSMLTDVALVFYNMLNSKTSSELQELAQKVSPMMSKHNDEILMNEELFERIQHVHDHTDHSALNREQRQLLDLTYKQFVRGGANLNDQDKQRLKDINEKLSSLTLQFGDNMLEETNSFELVVENEEDLSGLSQSLIEAAASTAKDRGYEGKWVFTLHNPSVMPFLATADSRPLRKEIKDAYVNRCNNDNEYDNKEIILDIVRLRIERAQLLGYDTHAQYVIEMNMAQSPENVYNLLDQIWEATLPVMNEEAEQYRKMLAEDGGDWTFDAADWRYYAEKYRKEKYDLDEEELKPYFQLENVKEGIFQVSEKLFGLQFKPLKDAPKYHEEVEVYEVLDAEGNHVSVLFMDFFPRDNKRGGAWMSSFRSQHIYNEQFVHPLVTINCNFSRPGEATPSLLTWDETTTFFHEFGHALHGMLSQCTYPSLSGTSVPRDFVEMPSQIMEHWAAEPEVLKMYAKHYETGEAIPDELIEKMKNAQFFNQGFATGEFLATAYQDMHFHDQETFEMNCPVEEEAFILDKIGLIPEIYSRHRSTYFSHGFSGGYSAGYYSYIWSEVLDSDAFGAFEENGLFHEETAQKLKKYIFANGHKDDPMTMFVNFRGREPNINPLLEKRGLN